MANLNCKSGLIVHQFGLKEVLAYTEDDYFAAVFLIDMHYNSLDCYIIPVGIAWVTKSRTNCS